MKITMRIFMGIFGLIGIFLIYATTRPGTFRVERSIEINAPAAKIFPYVNDLRKNAEWSPWEKMDTGMQRTYTEPQAGKGAAYSWSGNKAAGKGRMEITDSILSQRVVLALHFDEPTPADNTVEYLLSENNHATRVTWAMYGPRPYVEKVFSLLVDMDKMIGRQFEKGLQNLKTLIED
jgi:hypothetical protein